MNASSSGSANCSFYTWRWLKPCGWEQVKLHLVDWCLAAVGPKGETGLSEAYGSFLLSEKLYLELNYMVLSSNLLTDLENILLKVKIYNMCLWATTPHLSSITRLILSYEKPLKIHSSPTL